MDPNTASLRIVATTIFPISDMSEAVAFYRGLGFEVEAFDETYAWVRHDGDEILHLRLVPLLDPATNESAGYFHVEDAGSWHAAWKGGDVDLSDIEDHPWRMREVLVLRSKRQPDQGRTQPLDRSDQLLRAISPKGSSALERHFVCYVAESSDGISSPQRRVELMLWRLAGGWENRVGSRGTPAHTDWRSVT